VVPGFGPVTVAVLLPLPDDGYIYEVVEGVLVRVAGSGNRATRIALRLGGPYADTHVLGVATGADGVYKFPDAGTGLIPDVGYYSADHLPLITDEDKLIPFAPDLAIEVASPSQDSDDMAAKARLYLGAGTRLVWIVWPQSGHIDVWRGAAVTGPAAVLHTSDMLVGEDVVPGFAYPVVDLFADLRRDR